MRGRGRPRYGKDVAAAILISVGSAPFFLRMFLPYPWHDVDPDEQSLHDACHFCPRETMHLSEKIGAIETIPLRA